LIGQVMSPCATTVATAQQLPDCSSCNGTLCCNTRCWDSVMQQESDCLYAQQGCLFTGEACGGDSTFDLEPVCCGSGVDCRCPGSEYLGDDYDRVCNPGYGSYCCCHDTCCKATNWAICLTGCWISCASGC
jgi:hypothetical protein